jgi:hypothetical protein
MSHTYTQWSSASARAMCRQMNDENGVPWRNTTGDAPGSPSCAQRTEPIRDE